MREEFYYWTLFILSLGLFVSIVYYIFCSPNGLVRNIYTTEANGAICAGPWHYDNTEGKTL